MSIGKPRPRMTKFRKAQGMTIRQMANVCKCSPGLLYDIEFEGIITHPHIASRIAAAYMMDVNGYNDLVSLDRKAEKLPKPKMPPKETNIDKAWREGWKK